MTVRDAFTRTVHALRSRYGEREAHNLARLLVEDGLKRSLFQPERLLTQAEEERFEALLAPLRQGRPIQYVLGEAHFYGLVLEVNEAVLIPRPETEELVHWILAEEKLDALTVLDAGTGSGCIPLALKKKRPAWAVWAADVHEDALLIARRNAERLGLDVHFLRLDLLDDSTWDELPGLDILVSNPPYIPPSERHLMPPQVLQFEPESALFTTEEDPLQFYKALAGLGQQKLESGGRIYLECNEFRLHAVAELLSNYGYRSLCVQADMQGKERMIRAQKN
jgi:release factor glutamine methyltransferase